MNSFVNSETLGLTSIQQKKEEKESTISSKLKDVESTLKNKEVDHANVIASQGMTANRPTTYQNKLQNQFMTSDRLMNAYRNELGDYSNTTNQMNNDIQNATRAMNCSTLSSQREVDRIVDQNMTYNSLASEYGLMSVSNKNFKKSKNRNRLADESFFF
jgi:type IV secretory pathway VirJ component